MEAGGGEGGGVGEGDGAGKFEAEGEGGKVEGGVVLVFAAGLGG